MTDEPTNMNELVRTAAQPNTRSRQLAQRLGLTPPPHTPKPVEQEDTDPPPDAA